MESLTGSRADDHSHGDWEGGPTLDLVLFTRTAGQDLEVVTKLVSLSGGFGPVTDPGSSPSSGRPVEPVRSVRPNIPFYCWIGLEGFRLRALGFRGLRDTPKHRESRLWLSAPPAHVQQVLAVYPWSDRDNWLTDEVASLHRVLLDLCSELFRRSLIVCAGAADEGWTAPMHGRRGAFLVHPDVARRLKSAAATGGLTPAAF